MRAERLLRIILLLQTRPSITAGELAAQLHVSERTIYRDMEALDLTGIPVISERGNGGGWHLVEHYRTSLTGLNSADLQLLLLNQPTAQLSDLGLAGASDLALLKLLAALPPIYRQDANFARQRIHIDGARWRESVTREPTPFLLTIQEALWEERQIRLGYQRADAVSIDRLVDPLGLVAKGATWYLVAAVEGVPRTYRISRIASVEVLDKPAKRPHGFDLADYWEQSARQFTANLPTYPITVRANTETVQRMRYARGWGRVDHIEPADPTGWQTVVVICEEAEDALEYVLGFGTGLELIAPVELRATIARIATGIAALYGD